MNFDTAEFRRSDGPEFHGADAAWREGTTGSGAIIAVVDTGIDSDSPEFAGRIHPLSQDLVGNRGVDPEDDHGTNVALVAAAGRDDTGVLGIAFDAQILALRADSLGSCGTDTPQDPTLGCRFSDSAIADGVDVAIAAGATVINLSLGGSNASAQLRSAIARAANAGIVVVVAAGNGGDGSEPGIDPDQPDPFAASILQAGSGNVIIVGSVDDDTGFSDFSNRAGNAAGSFISALGDRICCVYDNGELFVETVDGQRFVTVFSGTSFAAPQVAGAAALLAQAFPNLTGQEIVEILLGSARDAGLSGTDTVFGTGILDIAAAFQPQGTTRVAGTSLALALTDDFALASAAMGDALSGASLSTIVTDRYDRAYEVELGQRGRNAVQLQRLRGAVEHGGYSRAAGNAALAVSVTVGESGRAAGLGWAEQLQLTPQDALGARVLAARVAARIAPDVQVGFAIGQSASGLTGQLQGADRPAFLIAGEAGRDTGFAGSSEFSFATRRELGPWGVTVSAERGSVWLGENRGSGDTLFGLQEQRPTSTFSIAADRRWQGVDASFAVSWLAEESTLLGAYFNPAVGIAGADTLFLVARMARQIGTYWRAGAAFRGGFTRPRGGALLGAGSQIETQSWSFDLTRRGAFLDGDSIGLRLSQPLRVSGGALHFDLPVAYDYASESAILGRQSLSLTPSGREIMGEMNWTAQLPFGLVSTSVFYRSEPGHFSSAPDDVGALITLRSSF
ncbi:S8 family peptidase [Qipengyuania sp. ASV99]|uniref:S8 family peptidase n=1 Tax=Qipengyuania sp. ASV99 TaxID=3399681 RepID=UPI003A4C8450